MKIALITSWYSEGMGYAENMLPKTFAELGHEVHLISANVQVYFNSPDYEKTYQKLLGPAIVAPETKIIDGYTLHRLNHSFSSNKIHLLNIEECLKSIDPDIIQTFELDEPATTAAAAFSKQNGKKLFTESHMHKSVFYKSRGKRIKGILKKVLPKEKHLKLINQQTKICYPIAEDVAELAVNYFGIDSKKIKIQSLGVDTALFRLPIGDEQNSRDELRKELGLSKEDIVCIYTGRFAKDKDPHTLALAIEFLSETNSNIKGLFVGNGTPEDIDFIKTKKNCVVKNFVKVSELNKYYWLADIGVWPRQESTSQLDAAACGLPLILSNQIHVKERVEGNGYLYEEGDFKDLAKKIMSLFDKNIRTSFGLIGNNKVMEKYSWKAIAQERIDDYKKAIKA